MDFEILKKMAQEAREKEITTLQVKQRMEQEIREAEEARQTRGAELLESYKQEVVQPFVDLFQKAFYDERDKDDAQPRHTLTVTIEDGTDEIGQYTVLASVKTAEKSINGGRVTTGEMGSTDSTYHPHYTEADGFTVTYEQHRESPGEQSSKTLHVESFIPNPMFRDLVSGDSDNPAPWDETSLAAAEAQVTDYAPVVGETIEMLEGFCRDAALNESFATNFVAYDQATAQSV